MNIAASRGALLVLTGIIVGALILGQGFDTDGTADVVTAGSTDTDSGESATDESAEAEGGEETGDGSGTEDGGTGEGTDGTVPEGGDGTDPPLSPEANPPEDVKVLVANGTSVNGAAGAASDALAARGYTMLSPTNADTQEQTFIYYEEGFQADAALIAQILSAPPTSVVPLPATDPAGVDRRGANVLVVLGNDGVTPDPG